jgi:hypothetical protein
MVIGAIFLLGVVCGNALDSNLDVALDVAVDL